MGPWAMVRAISCWLLIATGLTTWQVPAFERVATYRIEKKAAGPVRIDERFTPNQVDLLEKLNRADRDHLARLPDLVVPESWGPDERAYSMLPLGYLSAARYPKLLVVHLPGQLFGAYESGMLVRWGPINSGARRSQTPNGLFALNWRSTGHASSIDPDWYLRWYFNFGSREGLAFHEYTLPGLPVSHGCIRLLSRDARWLFDWGEPWSSAGRSDGTPVLIIGAYDFEAPPPWRSPAWLLQPLELPPFPIISSSLGIE